MSYPWEDLKAWGSWIMPCAFAQSELLRVAYDLLRGQLYLPGYGQVGKSPFARCILSPPWGRTAGIFTMVLRWAVN